MKNTTSPGKKRIRCHRWWPSLFAIFFMIPGASGPVSGRAQEESEKKATVRQPRVRKVVDQENLPASIEEARGRARWLHEVIHGTLQVVHRDFFDDDFPGAIPSKSLEDVFSQMGETWSVNIRWLGGNATKAIEHDPKDGFEKQAVRALVSGEKEFEAVERGRYRFAGAIRLQNECLKCHVPHRTSLEDRVAGLAISFPMKSPAVGAAPPAESVE